MLVRATGRIRGFFSGNYPENDEEQQMHLNNRGDQIVAQGLPERSELVRMGASWGAQLPTGSAFTFVATWPTTRAELVLCNGEDKGGKTYMIDRCWIANITSMGAAQPISMLGQLAPAALAIATAANNTAILRQSLSGKVTNYAGRAMLALANTAFAVANQWFPLGNGPIAPMTTNLGCSVEANVYGKYLVAPGAAFCLAGLAGTGAGRAICGIEWHEAQIIGA